VAAAQWVQQVSAQLTASRQYPMPHLSTLAHALGQTPFCVAQLLLETIFCFEYIQVDWPEALSPITSFGNANGQLGTHGRLQLSIDITEDRMRLAWWGMAHYISQSQLQAFEKSFEHTLMDLLRAVLQFNQWSRVDPRRKQLITLSEFGRAPVVGDMDDNLLQIIRRGVLQNPQACMVATEQRTVSRAVIWVAAAIFAHEVLQEHPQFSWGEKHHPVLLLADDPVEIVTLIVAAQLCALVPLITTVDARRTLLGDTHHVAWRSCRNEWLLTTCPVAGEAGEHVVVVTVGLDSLLQRAEQFLNACASGGITLLPWHSEAMQETPENLSVRAPSLPQACLSLWQSLRDFLHGNIVTAAANTPAQAPVFGYFDPIASVQCQQRIVSNSAYWLGQLPAFMHMLEKQEAKLARSATLDSARSVRPAEIGNDRDNPVLIETSQKYPKVMLVGQALDHAGLWPCMSALFAGAPLLWIMPERLLTLTPQHAEPLPHPIAHFLDHEPGMVEEAVAASAAERNRGTVGFLPELCYGLLVTERRLQAAFDALAARVRFVLIGEGRLRLPDDLGGLPPTLLSVCERESVSAPVYHAGDSYTSAGRALLGFVKPVVGRSKRRISHDALVLEALLPDVEVFAVGNQRGALDYARCTLRLHIEGVWPVDPPETAADHMLFCAEVATLPGEGGDQQSAVQGTIRRLHWELANTGILRGRQRPIIELEDTQFAPAGAWSATCRFWESVVSSYLPTCWTKVRPESQTLGQASVRVVPFDADGIPVQAQDAMMPFAQFAVAWARLHTPAGRHWGAGVTPRWDEIFSPKPNAPASPPLAQSMTLARLAERILKLPQTPKISQTWASLGGDWFGLFRLTFVLRRLGWTWTLPIRSLHQPLGRFALQLVRLENPELRQGNQSRYAKSKSPAEPVNKNEVDMHWLLAGSRTAPEQTLSEPRVVQSLNLSAYQLGVFRRYSQSLANQIHRLQFFYSGAMRLAQLRTALNRWISLFPTLTGYFELTGQGMQQRVLHHDPSDDTTVLQWTELLDHALDFQTEPFQSAYLEKLRLEDSAMQLQLNRPPLWCCVVYPKGQGRWSVWLMAHKLLFDTREWLDSVRCLELLLFEALDAGQVLPWLDTQVDSCRGDTSVALGDTLDVAQSAGASRPSEGQALPAHVQASVARFWQQRVDWGCGPLISRGAAHSRVENRLKTIVQPLPRNLNGKHWQQVAATTGVDRMTLLLWAVVQTLMRFQGVSSLRLDLDAPWSVMGAQAPQILTGQCGPTPIFLRCLHSPDFPLADFKQQLYEQMMAPNPECLLVPGSLAYEQFYDGLYSQDICFSYLESLPESPELTSMADVEQLRRVSPCEFLENTGGYNLKIEAFPSRESFVMVWRFHENALTSSAVEVFVHAVAALLRDTLSSWLAEIGLRDEAVLAASEVVCTEQTLAPQLDPSIAAQTESLKGSEGRSGQFGLSRSGRSVRHRYASPIDFGVSGMSETAWLACLKEFPTLEEIWQSTTVSAWAFQAVLNNPLARWRGTQATRCPAMPVSTFRDRLQTLALLVPEIAARWVVLPEGVTALVKATDCKPFVRQVGTRVEWDSLPPLAAMQDEQSLALPCLFTFFSVTERAMLVRCDYDVRALEPGLVSAILATFAEGSLKPIKSALPQLWLSNSGLGLSRAVRLRLNSAFHLGRAISRSSDQTTRGEIRKNDGRNMLPSEAYNQVRAVYWQNCFAPLVGAPQRRAWLPITEPVSDELVSNSKDSVRHTSLNVVSDRGGSLRGPLDALVSVLQMVRRYLVRLWGDQLWVINILFADRDSVVQAGLGEYWAQHPYTSPHCWLPVFLGDGHVSHDDEQALKVQLQRSAQYPLESEVELSRWLGWPSETVSDIGLVIVGGDPEAAAAQDWHRLQLLPLQFQWHPAAASTVRMAVHAGIDLSPVSQRSSVPTDLDILASQARYYEGVVRAQARRLDLTRVIGEFNALRDQSLRDRRTKQPRDFVILDVQLSRFPGSPGALAHRVQNFLAKRLTTGLLPDLVRICDDRTWGEAGCYAWLDRLHGSYQSQLKQRLTSLLFRSQPAVTTSALGDYRSWFWPVSEVLPGWQAERARDSLTATPERGDADTLSVRALRTLHHWAQWSEGGQVARRQRPVLSERRWELTPDQACWMAMSSPETGFFNTQLLLHFPAHTADMLVQVLKRLVLGDPIFRLQFSPMEQPHPAGGLSGHALQGFSALSDTDLVAAAVKRVTLPLESVEQTLDGITRVTQSWQGRFNLAAAPLVRLLLFDCGQHRGPYLALLGNRLAVDRHGLRHMALRLDKLLSGQGVGGLRSWQQWLAFLAQQRSQVRQLASVSRLFAAGVRHGEDSLYARASSVLGVSRQQLMHSHFEHRHIRRQFLPTICAQLPGILSTSDSAVQDSRSVLCLACIGLAFGRWLNLPEVVVGQWWPVRDDPRAKHWQEVVGTFEFVFKNKILLMNDSPLETAQRLSHYAPSALQDAISGALAKDQFDLFDAFSLFSFERVDDKLSIPNFDTCNLVQHSLGTNVEPANLRRSLIRIEAAFGSGQLDLRWVYDRKLVNVSLVESLVTRFSFYWNTLRHEIQALSVEQNGRPRFGGSASQIVRQTPRALTPNAPVGRGGKAPKGTVEETVIERENGHLQQSAGDDASVVEGGQASDRGILGVAVTAESVDYQGRVAKALLTQLPHWHGRPSAPGQQAVPERDINEALSPEPASGSFSDHGKPCIDAAIDAPVGTPAESSRVSTPFCDTLSNDGVGDKQVYSELTCQSESPSVDEEEPI
jgi:hypothetical protein